MKIVSLPCKNCEKIVNRSRAEYKKSKSGNIFCNQSCAATYNNKNKPPKYSCSDCGARVSRSATVRCQSCYAIHIRTAAYFARDGKLPEPHQLKTPAKQPTWLESSEEVKARIREAAYRHLKRKKLKYTEYLGGACKLCGYNKSLNALTFHHRDPREKEFTISGRSVSWARATKELDKCDLLCANCHQEVHYLPESELVKYRTMLRRRQKARAVEYLGGKCMHCGYNKINGALSFHHRDPLQKEVSIHFSWKFERLIPELDKCDLLCFNCHAEEHERIFNETGIPHQGRSRQASRSKSS